MLFLWSDLTKLTVYVRVKEYGKPYGINATTASFCVESCTNISNFRTSIQPMREAATSLSRHGKHGKRQKIIVKEWADSWSTWEIGKTVHTRTSSTQKNSIREAKFWLRMQYNGRICKVVLKQGARNHTSCGEEIGQSISLISIETKADHLYHG